MNAEEVKHQRTRLGSDAVTQPEEFLEGQKAYQHQKISVEFKPLEDPDIPPELSLENDQVDPAIQTTKTAQKQEGVSPIRRSRTKSEDCQYSIIGFLQKRIKTRLLSEQITSKLTISPPEQN